MATGNGFLLREAKPCQRLRWRRGGPLRLQILGGVLLSKAGFRFWAL